MNRAPKGTHAWGTRPLLDQLIIEEYQQILDQGVSVEAAVDKVVANWVEAGAVPDRDTYNRFRVRVTNAVENHNQTVFKALAVSSGLEGLES